jgi:hypothetical protein
MRPADLIVAAALGASLAYLSAARADVALFEYALNRDGVVGTTLPPGSTFDLGTGLGTVTLSFDTPGLHYAGLYVDHELDEALNTFFNELGTPGLGSPPAGLSWEIDEPGFVSGDIYDHFLLGQLDNSVGRLVPDDVSMALGWDFILGPGQTAAVSFLVTENRADFGPGAFYLQQQDPDSGTTLYFTSSLRFSQGGVVGGIPEPAFGLVGVLGLGLACGAARWRTC